VMKLVDRLVVMNFSAKLVEGVPAAVRADERERAAYLDGAPGNTEPAQAVAGAAAAGLPQDAMREATTRPLRPAEDLPS